MIEDEGLASLSMIKIVVNNLRKCEDFYRRIVSFGESKEYHFTLGARAFTQILMRENDSEKELVLMAFDDGKGPVPGSAVLTWQTDDLEMFRRRAIAAGGLEIGEERPLRLGSWHARIAEFIDPDGNQLQVLQTIAGESSS